ncbi:lITAF domain-containing protein [Nerophis lumbriciformis]|uniref:lITAF domain-containing protein n=1 Tax=Nerophis lumbriciformis TaxID=546530 RepID=UPI002ADF18F9|nr:lipopolysaccharide-induced tumor necrosis factor-alpha factor homolog [Nerophis lumbriciformis]
MSDIKNPPPYTIPVDGQGDKVKVYHVHTPFNPAVPEQSASSVPVYTGGGGGPTGGYGGSGRNYDNTLGRVSGMANCPSCQQQVMTNVEYKAGTYAWLMVLLFICLGLWCCCCIIPLLMKRFKDVHHFCPRCHRLLHVEKKKCCD